MCVCVCACVSVCVRQSGCLAEISCWMSLMNTKTICDISSLFVISVNYNHMNILYLLAYPSFCSIHNHQNNIILSFRKHLKLQSKILGGIHTLYFAEIFFLSCCMTLIMYKNACFFTTRLKQPSVNTVYKMYNIYSINVEVTANIF